MKQNKQKNSLSLIFNKKNWFVGMTLTVSILTSLSGWTGEQKSPDDLPLTKDFQQQWMTGLLSGKDMSAVSSSYGSAGHNMAQSAAGKKSVATSTSHLFERFNPLTHYQQAEQKFIDQIRRLLEVPTDSTNTKQAWSYKPQQQTFITDSFVQLQDEYQALDQWLNSLEARLDQPFKSQAKIDRSQQILKSYQNRMQVIETAMKLPVSEWSELTRSLLLKISQPSQKSTPIDNHTPIILRNQQLPFSNRNFAAPALNADFSVVPSYADETALAGGAGDLIGDEVVSLTPEIYAMAASLEFDYINIYNFVRQQITEQYYPGSMKGSVGTLLSYAGNDIDQAALLMALLRASNVPARFVQGVIEQPLEDIANGLGLGAGGNVEQTTQVLQALDRAGIAYQPVVQGGQIRAVRKQYTWVSAYVPYAHYRGSANDLNDPVWIPLAPAIKSTTLTDADTDYTTLNLAEDQLVMDYLTDPNITVSPIAYWQQQIQATQADFDVTSFTVVDNTTVALNLLPASLPFEAVGVSFEGAVLPDEQIQQVELELTAGGQQVSAVQLKMPQVVGRRLSLSYLPATVDDLNIINQAGGMSQVPPHLIDLRPVFKVDARQVVPTDQSAAQVIGMAQAHELLITLKSPSGEIQLTRTLLAGTYLSVVLGSQSDPYPLNNEDINLISDETKPIRLMHNLGVNYQQAWNQAEDDLAAVMNLAVIRPLPSVAIVAPEFSLDYIAGIPVRMAFKGISLDAVNRSVDVINRTSDTELPAAWMRLAALQGSWLESQVFNDQWATAAISADQGIRAQVGEGDTIQHITAANLASVLPSLNHPDYVKDHISEWINTGHEVLIPQNLTLQDTWQGSAWHIWHPSNGNSGYFIAGGYAGGQTTESPDDWVFDELAQQLSAPYAEGANNDPQAGRNISIIEESNNQYGVVNEVLAMTSQVRVTDAQNRPVVNALVRLSMQTQQAQFQTNAGLTSSTDVYTNDQGVAEVTVKLSENLGAGPFIQVNPGDSNLTRVGLVAISAVLFSDLGQIVMPEQFNHYAIPDAPAEIIINQCNWLQGICNIASGQQDMRAGNVYVTVVDQYNNPVPNVPIQITAEDPVPRADNGANKDLTAKAQDYTNQIHEQKPVAPAFSWGASSPTNSDQLVELGLKADQSKSSITGRCDELTPARIAANACFNLGEVNVPACATASATIDSNNSWEVFTLYNGHGYPATRFPITISATGLESKTINRYNGFSPDLNTFFPSGLFFTGDDTNGPNGDYFADQPNEVASKSIQPYFVNYTIDGGTDSCVVVQQTLASVENQSTSSVEGNAMLTVNSSPGSGGGEQWDIDYLMGDGAADNHNQIINDTMIFDGVGLYAGQSLSNISFSAYSTTATADVVARSPEAFILNDDLTTATATQLAVQILPAGYQPLDLTAMFYEDDELIYTFSTPYPIGSSQVVSLPAGIPIDPEKTQYIELVMNTDTEFEIRYEKQPLDGIERKLVTDVNCDHNSSLSGSCGGPIINQRFETPIRLSTDTDLANAAVCRNEGFGLNLTTDARVTIEAFKVGVDGVPTNERVLVVDNELMFQGENSLPAQAETFGNHAYNLIITATAEDNGDVEVVQGSLVSNYDISNSLPIGHAIVKGVDLADGSMVYSKQDIALQSPGVDLEFVRTYSSIGRHELGSLGFGWSHNYLSRVIVGNCGQVTVTGADGGSARFRLQDGEFVPLKGYHSSLVLNEDGTFDYYPKGGNRYHYVRMQDNSWWMDYVEDPNGNRLSVELIGRNDAPVIGSVTDSVGRRLVFEYELRIFGIYRHEMLVGVTGPDGIDLRFEYDGIGNLISASREGGSIGGATNETFTYSGDVSGPSRSLLLAVNDQATGAVRSWTYQEHNIEVPPAVGDIPDIASVEVTAITESDSGTTTFSYTDAPGYNSAAVVTQNGQVSDYTLNFYGAATEIVSPAGTKSFVWETDTDVLLTSETDENDRMRSFEHDEFGNVIEERLGTLISTYTYNSPDQFDPPFIKDRPATMTNWRGDTTTFDYDAAGNKTNEELDNTTTSYTYDDQGLVKTMTDGRGLVSIFTYDAFGYQMTARNPAGDTTTMSYNARGQKLSEEDGNGNQTTYTYDVSDRMLTKRLNSRLWTYSYTNGGRTRTETDPNSHSTTYDYDTQGRLTSTLNAAGDTMAYGYDLNGNKTLETDFGGHTTTFAYDDANRLITKTEPAGSAGTPKVTTYTYDNVGNVLTETTGDRLTTYTYDPDRYFQTSIERTSSTGNVLITRTVDGNGNILTETDPNQNETTFTYDAFDRMLTESGPMGSGQVLTYDPNGNVLTQTTNNSTSNQLTVNSYDTANRLIQTTLPEGGINTYTYDGNGNIKTETRPNGYHAEYGYNDLNLPTLKTINAQTWLLSYDLAGNLKTETWPNVNGGTGNVITYSYDELNREISKTDTMGPISIQTWDADSNLMSQTDGNGNFTSYSYNALHQRTSETKPLGRGHSYTYTAFDELLTDTGPNGVMTHSIDQLGRRIASTGPDNYDMSYGYDANGNLISQTDSRGIQTTFGVNALNQTESETTTGPGGPFTMTMTYDTIGNQLTQTDYRGIESLYTYDTENRQLTFTRAGELQSTTTYNKAGLPVVVKDARGNNTVHEYNVQYHKTRTLLPESQTIVFTPNAFGDVTLQNNPGPNDINRTYDLRRRLKTETNGAGETTTYEYDLNNNRTAVIKPTGARWEYDFDAANRLTAVKNIPEAITTTYTYDTADNLETITDAENKVTTFTYDDRNRKLTKTYPDTQVITYTYDPNDNLSTIGLPNGTNIAYTYDALNRQTSQDYTGTYGTANVSFTLDGNGNVETVSETIDGASYNYTMSYDLLDRMESKTDRYGKTFFYTYDPNGNRKQFRDHDSKVTDYNYDDLNRLEQLTQAGLGAFTWDYNPAGLPSRIDYPNGSQANYSYDNANRIALIDNTQSGVTVTSHAYEYDANGNRDMLTESNINASQITTYDYDDADRLTQVNYPTTINSYVLDKVGNRTSELIDSSGVLNTRTYGYNTRDQLTSVTDTDGLNLTYSYDAAGNQTEKIDNGLITTFDYTARQRVKDITVGAASPNEYQYDYAGQRINSQTNGLEKRYLYDGLTLIAETNTIGNTLATYHYGQTRQLAETRNTTSSFYLADALGTNVAITNADGSIQNRMDYDVWGNLNQETATSDSPFGFTGYIRDEDTELYYANARYYDSFTGRFLREDPFNGTSLTPPSLHRYLYANVNPTVYIDPTGNISICLNDHCLSTDNLLKSAQEGLENNEKILASNLRAQEAAANREGFSNDEVFANASSRLTTEALSSVNSVSRFLLNNFIAASQSGDPETLAAAESHMQKTAESIRNSANFVMENPGKAGNKVLTSISERTIDYMLTSYNAIKGDPSSRSDLLVKNAKIAAVAFPASRLNAGNKSFNIPSRKQGLFDRYPDTTTLKFDSLDEQVSFLTDNIPGLNSKQAMEILNIGFSRDSSVVFGGSRIRGDFNNSSDLDVGFGSLSQSQAQKAIKKHNKIGNNLVLEDNIRLVPGTQTSTVPLIQNVEEFFQRSGTRQGGDKKKGQRFNPSGSITATADGSIVIIPPKN